MSKIGKKKSLMSILHKILVTHEAFYPNEYKGPPKPGYDVLLIHR